MSSLMLLRPVNPLGSSYRIGGKIPVKIIAADRGKKNKTQKVEGRQCVKQQATRLHNHQHCA